MIRSPHSFHIPVMGTGHSVDMPVRVAPFGIDSVISLVDDLLLEKVRKYYCDLYSFDYVKIPRKEIDGRAKRITAYLDVVNDVVQEKLNAIKQLPFFQNSDKDRYFEMLPDESPLRALYSKIKALPADQRQEEEKRLTEAMIPGSIDVNIMVKLDKPNYDSQGNPLGADFSDAKEALRGFAKSKLDASIVFSAGINQGLYSCLHGFSDFFRDATGYLKKRIILKVSDFRSAMIQGKYLAKRGLEVYEYRIESGLNCGGHAFASQGNLLPGLLQEFKENRDSLAESVRPIVKKYYEENGMVYPEGEIDPPLLTVQGGIGCHGENQRMREGFGMDGTGWCSPFLLVPEATCVDDATRELLREAGPEDLYLSDASPIGVPYNNLRGSGSDVWTRGRCDAGNPGAPCKNQFLVSNTEFTDRPICTASGEYQKKKLAQIDAMDVSEEEKERLRAEVVIKECICYNLGNGALIALGIAEEKNAPQAVCPGPNIAWFNGTYSLKQMVDHIYGRGKSLVPPERPHMFAQEVLMYVDYLEKLVSKFDGSKKSVNYIMKFKENLERDMAFCLELAATEPYADENLAMVPQAIEEQQARVAAIISDLPVAE